MTEQESVVTAAEPKRGRGRPPKAKVFTEKNGVISSDSTEMKLSDMPKPNPPDDSADREKLIEDLKAALSPFAKLPFNTEKKMEDVEYKISRDNVTVEITKVQIIAAKKLLNLI